MQSLQSRSEASPYKPDEEKRLCAVCELFIAGPKLILGLVVGKEKSYESQDRFT